MLDSMTTLFIIFRSFIVTFSFMWLSVFLVQCFVCLFVCQKMREEICTDFSASFLEEPDLWD